MITSMRRRLSGDAGMSLIEVLVAMSVLGIVLTAAASTMISSLSAVASNERHSHATGVANQVLEDMQSVSWLSLGFYDSDSPDTSEGLPVSLGASRPAAEEGASPHPDGCDLPEGPSGDVPPLTEESVEREGVCYDVERWIVWENDGHGDYKRLVAEVSWDFRGRDSSLRASATRAPQMGDGVRLFTADLSSTPSTVNYDASPPTSASPATFEIVGTTSDPADNPPTLTYDDGGVDEPVIEMPTRSDGGQTWTWEIDARPGDPFPAGDVVFTFHATDDESGTLEAEATTTVRFLYGVPAGVSVKSLQLFEDTNPNPTPIAPDEEIPTKSSPASECGLPHPWNLLIEVDIEGLDSDDDQSVAIGWNGVDETEPLIAAYERPNDAGDGSIFSLVVNHDPLPESPVGFSVYYDGTKPPDGPPWVPDAPFWDDSNSYVTSSGDC